MAKLVDVESLKSFGSVAFSPAVPNDIPGIELDIDSLGIGPDIDDARLRFDLAEIDIDWEPEIGTLWAFMTPSDRPNYNLGMLRDSLRCMDATRARFGTAPSALRYMVVGSRFPNIFNLGGDLENFARWAEERNERALLDYGYLCVDLVHRVWTSNDMPMINIALVQGDAYGGGLESMLCFDVVIAERHARFCLPEIKFGLFPGMGAFSLLSRKVGHQQAERMIRGGLTYSAEELQAMGLIALVVDQGEGEAATRDYIKGLDSRHRGHLGIFQAARRVSPLSIAELREIVEIWVDNAMALSETDLRMMKRIAQSQSRITRSAGLLQASAAETPG